LVAEGHKGTDGRLYALDFARVMPPEAVTSPSQNGREIFYNLLRPSFVKNYPKQLCSDALSKWAEGDPHFLEINQDIENATIQLYKTTVPEFSKKLELVDVATVSYPCSSLTLFLVFSFIYLYCFFSIRRRHWWRTCTSRA